MVLRFIRVRIMDNLTFSILLLVLLTCWSSTYHVPGVGAEELTKFIRRHPETHHFFDQLKMSPYMSSVLDWTPGTLFIPTNKALHTFQQRRNFDEPTLRYHFANAPHSLASIQLESSISTELPGNPHIWVTRGSGGTIFLNEAKLLKCDLNVTLGSRGRGNSQVVHIIDTVLEATVPEPGQVSNLYNPDAGKFLENANAFKSVAGYNTATFAKQVRDHGKNALFGATGKHTFFIPVDEAFHNVNSRMVDGHVIDGHVILHQALFLRWSDDGELITVDMTFPTSGGAAGFPVILSLEKEALHGTPKWLVKSENLRGDARHRKGIVKAQIVRANIPVQNGVVHLISKPLALIDSNILQTLEWYANEQVGSMRFFLETLLHAEKESERRGTRLGIREILQGQKAPNGVTLLVPTNKAIEGSHDLRSIRSNTSALAEMIKTHILMEQVSKEMILQRGSDMTNPIQVPTAVSGRKALLNVQVTSSLLDVPIQVMYVEGGGVNGSLVDMDLGATNGFIHVIDRVLGFPDQNFNEMMMNHPLLQSTHRLWNNFEMDDMLASSIVQDLGSDGPISSRPLTFFAPSEKAWANLRRLRPSAYNALLSGNAEELSHLENLLQRHLIPSQLFTIEQLNALSFRAERERVIGRTLNESEYIYPIRSWNGSLKVNESRHLRDSRHSFSAGFDGSPTRGGEESHFYVYWKDVEALVTRPNLQCTDAIIHIIDEILITSEEISVTGGAARSGFKVENVLISLGIAILTRFVAG